MPTRHQLWYGRDEPPATRPVLRAGPVSAILDGPDLRHVTVGGIELVQRVYVAVRDAPWNTIPARCSDWLLDLGDDRFRVSFRARHRHEGIAFDWAGVIEGTADGAITYEMDGVCLGAFRYSKIGFNVHHALDGAVDRPFRAMTEAGELRGRLPVEIDPQRVVDGKLSGMFAPYSELAIEVVDGLEAVVGLQGDLLELQDHRNWADANFKSYGTPLALGFPFDSREGQRIFQKLTIGYAGATPPPVRVGERVIEVGAPVGERLPAIGLGSASHGDALSDREVALLAALRPAHLRVDLSLADGGHLAALDRAAADARAIGCPLELAVHANAAQGDVLSRLAEHLVEVREHGPGVARVLVYPASDGFSAVAATTPAALVTLVRGQLRPAVGPVVFAGGTDQSFVDVNRDRPSDPVVAGICFAVSPSVHAADDWSIVENLAGISAVVAMARTVADGRSVHVSPLTMATRFGPYPGGPAGPDDLPPAVDVRQVSLLGAAWTVGAIAELAAARADTATLYETTGWRGVIERDGGSPRPDRFPSRPGQVFPLYHVLADVAGWSGARVLQVGSSHQLDVVALAVEDAGGTHALVANVTPEAQRVLVRGLGPGLRVRMLDEATAQWALDDPAAFRATPGQPLVGDDDRAWLALGPFAVARLDGSA